MQRSRLMQRTAFVVALSLASSIAMAQNVAVVNNKPISKAREDAWVKELTKQGQAGFAGAAQAGEGAVDSK